VSGVCNRCGGTGMNKHSRWACDFCGGTGHVSIVDALAGWAVLLVIVGSILALGEWIWHLFAKK
jgi:hypothetical protein